MLSAPHVPGGHFHIIQLHLQRSSLTPFLPQGSRHLETSVSGEENPIMGAGNPVGAGPWLGPPGPPVVWVQPLGRGGGEVGGGGQEVRGAGGGGPGEQGEGGGHG